MSKTFYTNVRRVGNSILVRGYENSMPVDKEVKYQPHLFLPAQGKETEYRTFKTKYPVVKKTFDSIKAFQEYAESYSNVPNFKIYGCSDILRQFLNDYYVGEIDWSFDLTKVWYFDIETKSERRKYQKSHPILARKVGEEKSFQTNIKDVEKSIGIEVWDEDKDVWVALKDSCYDEHIGGFQTAAKAEAEMLLITMFEKSEKTMHVWSMRPVSPSNPIYEKFQKCDVRVFDDESKFLSDFCMFMRTVRIDVLTGWNSESFDIPYIVNRISNVLGESFMKLISPWKIIKPRTVKPDNFDPFTTYDIGGITHLDALDLYKKFNPGSQESFTLDHIAFMELGERKVDIPVDSFKESYSPEHWETFVLYCCVDTYLVYKIDQKMQHTMLAMQLAFLAKCAFADVISAMRLWESIIYGHFIEQNIVEEFVKPKNHKENIVGAFVLEPVPGKYGHTFSIDAEQLYPSMMMQHNISPETVLRVIEGVSIESILRGEFPQDFNPETECLSANGLVTTKSVRGFIPELVDLMGKRRKVTKKKMLELKSEQELIKAELKTLGVVIDE
jgi:DNA polymerase elongation subunit (family B)